MDGSNAAIIRKVYEDLARGNISAVFGAFDHNIASHIPGHTAFALLSKQESKLVLFTGVRRRAATHFKTKTKGEK